MKAETELQLIPDLQKQIMELKTQIVNIRQEEIEKNQKDIIRIKVNHGQEMKE